MPTTIGGCRVAWFALGAFLATITTSRAAEADERAAILRLAEDKRAALISSGDADTIGAAGKNVFVGGTGCFIDGDGLAVFGAGVFGIKGKLIFLDADQKELKAPRLLHIDQRHGLAFADFDVKPKVWITPRQEPVPVGTEMVGILSAAPARPVALVGPVLGRVSRGSMNWVEPRLQTLMTIGSGMPVGPVGFGTGAPVIDAQGRLCGVFSSARPLQLVPAGIQHQLTAFPSDLWFVEIAEARKATKAIPYPLANELNPFDPADKHPQYAQAIWAQVKGEYEKALGFAEAAMKDHPQSRLLLNLRIDLCRAAGRKDVMEMTKQLDPGPEAGRLKRALFALRMGDAHRLAGDLAKAEQCYREAVDLSPADFATPRWNLARVLYIQGMTKEAIDWAMQAKVGAPDHLHLHHTLGDWLRAEQRWDEEARISEQIDALERLYRTVLR